MPVAAFFTFSVPPPLANPPAINLPDKPTHLQGECVVLRPLEEADQQQRLALGRDPEFHRQVGGEPSRSRLPLTDQDVERWYARHACEPLFWAIDLSGSLIGTTWLHSLDIRNRRACYAIGIFAPEHRGQGYGREATHLVLGYAFGVLGLHRVELRVLAFNTRAIAMYERCGFKQEGVEREAVLIAGTWHDDVRMAILARDHGAQPRDETKLLQRTRGGA